MDIYKQFNDEASLYDYASEWELKRVPEFAGMNMAEIHEWIKIQTDRYLNRMEKERLERLEKERAEDVEYIKKEGDKLYTLSMGPVHIEDVVLLNIKLENGLVYVSADDIARGTKYVKFSVSPDKKMYIPGSGMRLITRLAGYSPRRY